MKGNLSQDKGTLIEMFLTFESGFALSIQPLVNDAAVIIFNKHGAEHLNEEIVSSQGVLSVIDHSGKIVETYELPGEIKAVENTVLYPDGKVWTGNPFEDSELNEICLAVLTEKALSLVKPDPSLTFEAANDELRPTILVKCSDTYSQKCGNHQCGRCFAFDKFIPNGLFLQE